MSLDGHFPNFKQFKFVKRLTFPLQENLGEVGPSKTLDSHLSWGERAVFSPQKSNERIDTKKLPYFFSVVHFSKPYPLLVFGDERNCLWKHSVLDVSFNPIRVSHGDKLV